MRNFFGHRPTSEILILIITCTVVGYIFLSMVILTCLIFFTDIDPTGVARNLADIINTLIGLLAGFLAGRSGLGKKNGNGTDKEPQSPSASG